MALLNWKFLDDFFSNHINGIFCISYDVFYIDILQPYLHFFKIAFAQKATFSRTLLKPICHNYLTHFRYLLKCSDLLVRHLDFAIEEDSFSMRQINKTVLTGE
jgi:hypothetical protein